MTENFGYDEQSRPVSETGGAENESSQYDANGSRIAQHNTSGTAKETVLGFYKQAIPADSMACAVAFAIEQPDDVDINEIVIRPTIQDF